MSIFTNYTTANSRKNFLGSLEDALLLPSVTAFGRKVDVLGAPNNGEQFIARKVDSIAVRILTGCVATLFFPITLAGLALRLSSISHKNLVKKEREQFEKNKQILIKMKQITTELSSKSSSPSGAHELTEIARNIIEAVEVAPKDHVDLIATWVCKVDEWLKDPKDAGYKDLLALKRAIKTLCRYQNEGWLTGVSLEQVQAKVRAFYYKFFSVDHILRNLQEKRKIPALGIPLKDLVAGGFKTEYQDFEKSIEEIRETFSAKETPESVTWVHGTQSPTLVAVLRDGLLKPAGQIRQDNGLAFCGENGRGSFGISEKNISGVSLNHYYEALAYAILGFSPIVSSYDEIGPLCITDPKQVIEKYSQEFNSQLATDLSDWSRWVWDEYISTRDTPTVCNNFHRHMKILMALEPEAFKQILLPLLKKLIQRLNETKEVVEQELKVPPNIMSTIELVFKNKYEIVPKFFDEKPVYSEEDKAFMQKRIPIIFGSCNIKTENNDSKVQYEKSAEPIRSCVSGEYVYKGSLKIGQDLPFVFTGQNYVQEVRSFLQKKGLGNIRVCNIESLALAPKLAAFRAAKAHKRT